MVEDTDKRNLVYLSIGTNMGDRKANIEAASQALSKFSKVVATSSIFETEAWGDIPLNPFYNIVLAIKTKINPHDLLLACQQIEFEMGRVKQLSQVYENRVIDIDLLFFNDEIVQTNTLTIPHSLLCKRLFVLKPLVDLAPELIHPVQNKSISDLLSICDDETVVRKIKLRII